MPIFPVINGRRMAPRVSSTDKVEKQKRVVNYDEEFLFHIFALQGGSIEKMLDFRAQCGPDKQAQIPKRTALFQLARRKHWRRRYAELKKSVKEDLESEVAMTYARIDQLGKLVFTAYHNHIFDIVKGNAKGKVNYKDLELLWKMGRTERGLPTNITTQNVQGGHIDDIERNLRAAPGGNALLDVIDALPSEMQLAFEQNLHRKNYPQANEDNDGIPAIIRKR